MNKRIKLIHNRIEELKGKLESSFLDLSNAHAERFLECLDCRKKSKARTCTGIDYRYWDNNTGSPCGGFYTHDYYAWECPKCGNYKNNEIESDEFWEMKNAFKDNRTEDE